MTVSIAAAQNFYMAAAGILPLLMVVLLVGHERVIRTDEAGLSDWPVTALMAILVTGLLVVGEMAALRVLSLGHDSFLLYGATTLALIYGFGFIFAQATKLILLGRADEIADQRKHALGRLYIVAVLVSLLLSYAILWPELGLFNSSF